MIAENISEHVPGIGTFLRMLAKPGVLDELRHGSQRQTVKCAGPLRNFVDNFLQLFVVNSKNFAIELGPENVPVVVSCLGVKEIFIREQSIQDGDDALRCWSDRPIVGFINVPPYK